MTEDVLIMRTIAGSLIAFGLLFLLCAVEGFWRDRREHRRVDRIMGKDDRG